MLTRLRYFALALLLTMTASAAENVIINELYYNPPDNDRDEFIEIYNPTSSPIDMSGYGFTAGITYTFPPNTVIEAGGYLVLARDMEANIWRRHPRERIGPYEGKLINSGEKLTLVAEDGRLVDSVTYKDFTPWPRGADGYDSSLERISPDLPSEDFHAWRSSVGKDGTPGYRNSTADVPPNPVITDVRFTPEHPRSSDEVQVQVLLDGPELIRSVLLRYETLRSSSSTLLTTKTRPMVLQEEDPRMATFLGTIPAQRSETLVRCNFKVTLEDGSEILLPHSAEPRPFESYFVYDNDIPTLLPILWMFSTQAKSTLPEFSRSITAAVVKPVDVDHVLVFDGARIYDSRSGQKMKFLKGEEYRGDRTLNVLPEVPRGSTTSGGQAPHVEHIAHGLFKDFGVLAPRVDWFRVIENNQHTQRLAIQQPNERFLEINDRDPNANIYKIAYNEPNRYPYLPGRINYSKQTNTDEGVEDLYEFFGAINSDDPERRAEALRRFLVVEEVMGYSVAGVLMSNWDGFFNNMFLVHNPLPIDRWECVPWDLDKTFGYTDSDHMFVEMPLEFPLNGNARRASREPGPVSRPFHMDPVFHQEYLKRVREGLDGLFSRERVSGLMEQIERVLLDDLELLEQHTGRRGDSRRDQIIQSYDTMETFMRLRHEYLRAHLPTPVEEWSLY